MPFEIHLSFQSQHPLYDLGKGRGRGRGREEEEEKEATEEEETVEAEGKRHDKHLSPGDAITPMKLPLYYYSLQPTKSPACKHQSL